jgi:AraC-like DNA-binding protein
VLTIALEVGYGSIGPFNRAFKERFGVTPTEYRRQNSTSHSPFPESA